MEQYAVCLETNTDPSFKWEQIANREMQKIMVNLPSTQQKHLFPCIRRYSCSAQLSLIVFANVVAIFNDHNARLQDEVRSVNCLPWCLHLRMRQQHRKIRTDLPTITAFVCRSSKQNILRETLLLTRCFMKCCFTQGCISPVSLI